MARQEINLGTSPTGFGGDPPRTASQKINFMTQELYEGLPTTAAPLPIAKGGTGGKTPEAARTGLGLGSAALMAAVGVGAIIERGKTANGEYVKFADGTLIQWGSSSTNVTTLTSNAYGSSSGALYVDNATINLVTPFYSTAYYASAASTARGFSSLAIIQTTSTFISQMQHPLSGTYIPYSWLAVGRWKA